ncbi:MAG: molybdopterin converting factor subunit 1 [Alphaproteobacteria bacterium]|nr:molybdopterin converting factor subunit 1 [Alphaproteobacteria bacterium]
MRIMYFAWMREHIGASLEQIDKPDHVTTVADLISHLRGVSAGHALALSNMEVVRVAVNQNYTSLDAPLNDQDEVAFFPPVTGG